MSKRLCNCKAVKAYTLGAVARLRPGCVSKFTRVSGSVYDSVDAEIRDHIDRLVRAHPSIGKTIMVPRVKDLRNAGEGD